jgi:hypothetical protein
MAFLLGDVMGTKPRIRWGARHVLYLLLLAVLLAFGVTTWIELKCKTFDFTPTNWLFLFATFLAVVGWIITAIVNLRNSIKQHTINTLLQSRLSTAFNQRTDDLAAVYPTGKILTESDLTNTDPNNLAALAALKYFLNHHEFVAVGISHGDLSHDVLKSSLEGIVVGLYEKAEVYIKARQREDPQNFEHFVWLYERWKPKGN